MNTDSFTGLDPLGSYINTDVCVQSPGSKTTMNVEAHHSVVLFLRQCGHIPVDV